MIQIPTTYANLTGGRAPVWLKCQISFLKLEKLIQCSFQQNMLIDFFDLTGLNQPVRSGITLVYTLSYLQVLYSTHGMK